MCAILHNGVKVQSPQQKNERGGSYVTTTNFVGSAGRNDPVCAISRLGVLGSRIRFAQSDYVTSGVYPDHPHRVSGRGFA
jgi:hypothetical protein